MRTTFVLPGYFARQSTRQRLNGLSRSSRAQLTTALCIGLVVATGLVTATNARTVADLAFGLGLMAPGAGFVAPVLTSGAGHPMALALTLAAASTFVVALLLWFGTGNVLAPPAAWLGAAGLAAWRSGYAPPTIWPVPQTIILVTATIMPLILSAAVALARGGVCPTRTNAEVQLRPLVAAPQVGELDLPTLQLQRLLLDRALQPVEAFEGFEWRDQFQTAAVRYQLNFVSYPLSIVHAHQLPAFSGYMLHAQQRLLAKQSDPRMWRYWAWESAWGHLRRSADPVPRDNIMYTDFVAAQIAMAEAASGRTIADGGPHLRLVAPGGQRFAYEQSDLTGILADQYRRAPWGLLACEPHWIYPRATEPHRRHRFQRMMQRGKVHRDARQSRPFLQPLELMTVLRAVRIGAADIDAVVDRVEHAADQKRPPDDRRAGFGHHRQVGTRCRGRRVPRQEAHVLPRRAAHGVRGPCR